MVAFCCETQLAKECYTGWLGEVVDVFQEDTEWSKELIFGCAAVELGLAIGRDAYVWYFANLYPNLYVIALGRPGKAHKTAISREVKNLGWQADKGAGQPIRRFAVSSAEGVLEQFCEKVEVAKTDPNGKKPKITTELQPIPGQRVLLDENEFTSILKKSRRPATSNIPETLRTLWDGDSKKYPTRNRSIEIEDPFCCLISASTHDALEQSMLPEDVMDGTIPRCMFLFCTPREPVAYSPPFNPEDINTLVSKLADIRQFVRSDIKGGYVPLSPAAVAEWEKYYCDLDKYAQTLPDLPQHMMNRVPTMTMKFALLYAAQSQHNEIAIEDMELATQVGNYLAYTATSVTGQTYKHPVAREEERILRAIKRRYPQAMPYRDVQQLLKGKFSGDTLRKMLSAMSEGGLVEEVENSRGTKAYLHLPQYEAEVTVNTNGKHPI
jgi:uncharacterized protein DUF3987